MDRVHRSVSAPPAPRGARSRRDTVATARRPLRPETRRARRSAERRVLRTDPARRSVVARAVAQRQASCGPAPRRRARWRAGVVRCARSQHRLADRSGARGMADRARVRSVAASVRSGDERRVARGRSHRRARACRASARMGVAGRDEADVESRGGGGFPRRVARRFARSRGRGGRCHGRLDTRCADRDDRGALDRAAGRESLAGADASAGVTLARARVARGPRRVGARGRPRASARRCSESSRRPPRTAATTLCCAE